MIENIVGSINNSIAEKLSSYPILIHGIAEPITIKKEIGDDEVTIPCVIDGAGECFDVFIDDDYRFGCYHRVMSKSYITETQKGYGDGLRVIEVYDISLVCWAFNSKNVNLERMIYSCFPTAARPYSSNFDKKKVFLEETSNVDFFLLPESSLLSVKYKVQIKQPKICVEIENIFND